jgi:hypothetical protein
MDGGGATSVAAGAGEATLEVEGVDEGGEVVLKIEQGRRPRLGEKEGNTQRGTSPVLG